MACGAALWRAWSLILLLMVMNCYCQDGGANITFPPDNDFSTEGKPSPLGATILPPS